jgi:hypothetical protein
VSKNKETNTANVLVYSVKHDWVMSPSHDLIVSKSSSKLLDVLTIFDKVFITDRLLIDVLSYRQHCLINCYRYYL